jgi:hypothetical protein
MFAAKEARESNLDLKRQVRHIGNYFTNSVETCAQEAAYLTLQLPLTKATRKVVFINTSPSGKRTFLLKKSSALEKLSPNSTNIECLMVIPFFNVILIFPELSKLSSISESSSVEGNCTWNPTKRARRS